LEVYLFVLNTELKTDLGTDVEYEKPRLTKMNIIICTPGRLLQHMDENEHFSCEQLQVLVIDEADRILDMGFRKQVRTKWVLNVSQIIKI
jgi:superfamily II DNA/RNA helicase